MKDGVTRTRPIIKTQNLKENDLQMVQRMFVGYFSLLIVSSWFEAYVSPNRFSLSKCARLKGMLKSVLFLLKLLFGVTKISQKALLVDIFLYGLIDTNSLILNSCDNPLFPMIDLERSEPVGIKPFDTADIWHYGHLAQW